MTEPADVTRLLLAWSEGEPAAADALMEAVYTDLRRMARGYLSRERSDHTLPPTALVHEAYVRLVDQRHVRWQNRAHFFAIAARVMRRILVDHARARASLKRGGAEPVRLLVEDSQLEPPLVDILALDVALDRLAAIDARQSQLVELRFFAGLTIEEVASVLSVSVVTVKRDWALARAWLYRELQGVGPS
jgi:RNA polymerase sigma factor (TIGR02999 family)